MKRIGIGISGGILGAVPWAVGALALFGLTNCGIYGGGGGGGGGRGATADVEGDIAVVKPEDSGRDIVVFVFDVGDAEHPDCKVPELPDNLSRYKYAIVPPGETLFEIPNTEIGRLVVVFLLDGEGGDADGRIDPGDPVAVLNDPNCTLDDVPEDYVVTVDSTRINFTLDEFVGMPEPGRADADISENPQP